MRHLSGTEEDAAFLQLLSHPPQQPATPSYPSYPAAVNFGSFIAPSPDGPPGAVSEEWPVLGTPAPLRPRSRQQQQMQMQNGRATTPPAVLSSPPRPGARSASPGPRYFWQTYPAKPMHQQALLPAAAGPAVQPPAAYALQPPPLMLPQLHSYQPQPVHREHREGGQAIVQRLVSRVAALLPHLQPVLHSAALAVLLLTADAGGARSRASSDAWFKPRLKADAGPWEAPLAGWMMPALTALETDDGLALRTIEAGLRGLLDTYVLGGDLPAAAVLHGTWSDSLLPGGDEAVHEQPRGPHTGSWPIATVDFLSTVSVLLHLRGSGVRLLPPRPAAMQGADEATRGAPAPWQGALGRPRPVPGPLEPALAAVDKAVRAAGRDIRRLLGSRLPEGLGRSPNVDFGVWPSGSLHRTLYRQVWIRNQRDKPLWLLDVRMIPSGGPKAFLVDDDYGLATEEKGLPLSLGIFCGDEGGSEDGGAQLGPRMRVCLQPSEAYVLTVQLDPQAGREGMLAAAVVVTVAWDDGGEQAEPFCVGWRASATLVPSTVAGKLRPEAPPFVPHWQQVYFNAPANLHTLDPNGIHEMLRINLSFAWETLDDVAPCVTDQQRAGSWQQSSLGLKFWTSVEEQLNQHLRYGMGAVKGQYRPEEADQRARRRTVLIRMARALAVEEATMESDIRKYDMFDVRPELCQHNPGERKYKVLSLGSKGRNGVWTGFQTEMPRGKPDPKKLIRDFLMIEVKGLLEERPALAMGDTVFLRLLLPDSNLLQEFACLVVAIDKEQVALMPPPAWWGLFGTNSSKFPPVNIRLAFDRVLFRRMGAALVRAAKHAMELFPEISPVDGSDSYVERLQGSCSLHAGADNLQLCNPNLNSEQRDAVARAVARAQATQEEAYKESAMKRPFILFGPAGTGKTLTLTEVVLQAMKSNPEGRILACAPTSDTADIFCLGLAKAGLTKDSMVRLNDVRRSPVTVRPGVLDFCMIQQHVAGGSRRPFFCVAMDALHKAQVIVASCSSSAVLESFVSQIGGFDYVVMDEAAQALIPEALIPLTLAKPSGSSIVLAGDPRQMGPVVRCQYSAAAPALQDSLQQQWLRCTGPSAPDICMLPRNYRSSAPLLELPSRLFYNECLIAEAPDDITRPPRWEELLVGAQDGSAGGGGHREILFYGVMGKQVAKDPKVPSWSNPLEAHRCAELVAGLLAEAGYRRSIDDGENHGSGAALMQEDIGVMAPFRKQVYEIRRLLRAKNLGEVRVGTVDDFQGQEARVIFISTTLTRVASLRQNEGGDSDSDIVTIPTLLSDTQRFCVAITRAQALLVVVGHPVLLLEANTWRNVITHCAARGAYKGAGSETLAAKLGRGVIPEFEDGEEEQLYDDLSDLDDAVATICQMAVLGSGDADSVFPDLDLPETLAAAYSEETPWRIAL